MDAWAAVVLAGNGYRVADRVAVVLDDPPLTLDGIIGPRPAWHRDAACREHVDLDWFPHGGRTAHALLDVCAACLVRVECADAGLHEGFGIWGGLTVVDRRRALAGGVAA